LRRPSDIFYVKPRITNILFNDTTTLIPAQFVSDGIGGYVVNPNPPKTDASYSNTYFNADGSVIENANPNNYLVAPYGYSVANALNLGTAWSVQGQPATEGFLLGAFPQGAPQDLQRTYFDAAGNLVQNGPPVPAFTDAASFHLGLVGYASGVPQNLTLLGGGGYNVVFGGANTQGVNGNNPRNVNSINFGYQFAATAGLPNVFDAVNGLQTYQANSPMVQAGILANQYQNQMPWPNSPDAQPTTSPYGGLYTAQPSQPVFNGPADMGYGTAPGGNGVSFAAPSLGGSSVWQNGEPAFVAPTTTYVAPYVAPPAIDNSYLYNPPTYIDLSSIGMTPSWDAPVQWSGWDDSSSFDSLYAPVVLDLTGNGINLTQKSSSNTYFDMAGDGEKHLTAWAGAGSGVLFIDTSGAGVLSQANQVVFTDWDPSAKSDLQALLDVFDTNHNGALDAGDTSFSKFFVMKTNADGTQTSVSLASLGITSINLTANQANIALPDGSSIDGETTYTSTVNGVAYERILNTGVVSLMRPCYRLGRKFMKTMARRANRSDWLFGLTGLQMQVYSGGT